METIQPDTTAQPAPPLPADDATTARLLKKAALQRHIVRLGRIISGSGVVILFESINLGADNGLYGIIGAALLSVFTMFGGVSIERAANSRRSKAIAELTQGNSLHLLGPLIENMDTQLDEEGIHLALTALLPRLQASDAHLLTAQHHRIFNGLLHSSTRYPYDSRTALFLAILKVYEQVGNKEDLPVVERLAKGKGYAKRIVKIQQAAQSCLPYLQARSEQQAARETLLRASSAVSDDGASLLRSAHEAGSTNSQQLLRASNSEPLE